MRRQDQNGFTLLETLVVVVVFGILLLGLTRGMRLGIQMWDRQNAQISAADDLFAVQSTIRRLIEQIDPGTGAETADIDGTGQTLRFITRLPDAIGVGPTHRGLAILFVDPGHGLSLRWAAQPHVASAPTAPPTDTVLLPGVLGMVIGYRSDPATTTWLSEWHGGAPPLLIRIHVLFAPDDPRRWPDLVVMPMRQRDGA